MGYFPHRLFVRGDSKSRDEFHRTVPDGHCWKEVCRCRCDDSGLNQIVTENGEMHRPSYHIVLEGHHRIPNDTFVRVLDGNSMRGEGKVVNAKSLNVLPYSEIWV